MVRLLRNRIKTTLPLAVNCLTANVVACVHLLFHSRGTLCWSRSPRLSLTTGDADLAQGHLNDMQDRFHELCQRVQLGLTERIDKLNAPPQDGNQQDGNNAYANVNYNQW